MALTFIQHLLEMTSSSQAGKEQDDKIELGPNELDLDDELQGRNIDNSPAGKKANRKFVRDSIATAKRIAAKKK